MSTVSSFIYSKDGLRVKYTLEQEYSVPDSWHEGYPVVPTGFMPFPGFEKPGFFQAIKYRIRTGDWFGTKERQHRDEAWLTHEDTRIRAWRQKVQDDKKKRELEIAAACTPEKLRASGVDSVLHRINNAKDIDISGSCLNRYDNFYQKAELSWIDGMIVDLDKRTVVYEDGVELNIPDMQVRPVYDAIDAWRQFVMAHGTQIR